MQSIARRAAANARQRTGASGGVTALLVATGTKASHSLNRENKLLQPENPSNEHELNWREF